MSSYGNDKPGILARLRRMEGQLKGIQRMVEEDRYCVDVLNQLSSVIAATQRVAGIILQNHIRGCVNDALIRDEHGDGHIDELMTIIERFTRK